MAVERTFSIVKPDAVERSLIGSILSMFESAGLKIVAGRLQKLSVAEAEQFYAVHRERPFFGELVEYISSGPVFLSVLEGENAVLRNREIMGATDPKKASPESVRGRFGIDISRNSVHGSDSVDNARIEILQFFPTGVL